MSHMYLRLYGSIYHWGRSRVPRGASRAGRSWYRRLDGRRCYRRIPSRRLCCSCYVHHCSR